MKFDDTLIAAIRNDSWLVRHYSSRNADKFKAAIEKLGITVKFAFMHSDDYAPMLIAIADGLSERDDACVIRPARRPRR